MSEDLAWLLTYEQRRTALYNFLAEEVEEERHSASIGRGSDIRWMMFNSLLDGLVKAALAEGEKPRLPITGEDDQGTWYSKHQDGYRAPEVVRELEWRNPTLSAQRLRDEDFGGK